MKDKELFEKRKEMICRLVEDDVYVPMKEKELAAFMQVAKEDRDELKEVLDALVMEGKLRVTVKGKYMKGDDSVKIGTFTSHPRGFGFVTVEGMKEDLFIPESCVHGAMHKDTVRVVIAVGRRGKRLEAEVTDIIARGFTQIVGTFQQSKNFGFVVPDNTKFAHDIFIPKEKINGAVEGHKVVAEITDYGSKSKNPEGKIVEILGHVNDPGVDIMSIVKGFELPTEFSEKQLEQAKRVAKPVSEADQYGRMDLRNMQMVTIDGEDAKDLDDAVSLSLEDGFYHLGVHIADVTNYVQENSALDREALERGTSVYLVDRVIPMLPHTLSNGICSLNAGEDRLALSCLMKIDEKGAVVDYKITESVINVNRRMTYTAVKQILEDENPEVIAEYETLVPMFKEMGKLSAILREGRRKRGSIDFDFPESKILLDKDGVPLDIMPYERNVATKLIEDFMLLANETVAQHFYWLEAPFVYRTHDNPDADRIRKLVYLLKGFGFTIKAGREEVHPKEIQKLLQKVEGSDAEAMISRLTLRSMKQAKYTPECTGHFGLACQYYCHFTSPIRRYPDLQIHRIIKEQLRGRLNEERIEHYKAILEGVAKQCSERERRADEAERETDKLKKVEYMEQHIGETFSGVVSGVTAWGIYVELPNTVEGMIPVDYLPGDYYTYDEEHFELIGEHLGNSFTLGQKLEVEVYKVDTFAKTIDFVLAE